MMFMIRRTVFPLFTAAAIFSAGNASAQSCTHPIREKLTFVRIFDTTKTYDFSQAHILPIFNAPNDSAPSGTVLVKNMFTSDEGNITYTIQSERGHSSVFTPDIYDSEGSYAHQTLLERRGDWYKIALPTGEQAGWVKLSNPDSVTLDKGEIIYFHKDTWDEKFYVIVDTNADEIVVRDQQQADLDARDPDNHNPAPFTPFELQKIPLSTLYGPGCSLKVTIAYTRGC